MRKQKYNPERVCITFNLHHDGPYSFSLSEIYKIQNAAKLILKRALADKFKASIRGICYKLYTEADFGKSTTICQLVARIAARWPHSAAPGVCYRFPVPRTKDDFLWKGEALKYRISLLRYIIKRLKDTIRRAEKNGKATIR